MAEISEDEQIDLLFKKFTNTVNANPELPFSDTQNRRFPFQNFEFSKNLFIDNIPDNLDNITYNGLLGSAALDASFGEATDISYEIPNYPLLYYHRIELTNALAGLNNTSWYYPDPNNNKLSLLRGSIPFNYDPINFTYKQLLYSNSNQEEPLNSDPLYWLFDYKSGFIQFYGDPAEVTNWVNSNRPPRISVIVYNGRKGLENFSGGGGGGSTIDGNISSLDISGNISTNNLFMNLRQDIGYNGITEIGTISHVNFNERFGYSISLNNDGTIIVVSVPGASGSVVGSNSAGRVRVYQYNGSSWNQYGTPIYGIIKDEFIGISVKINSEGNKFIVGSLNKAKVYQYNGSSSSWDQIGSDITGVSDSHHIVSIDSEGNRIAVGEPKKNSSNGIVRIFDYNGSYWDQIGSITSANGEYFGGIVELSDDGTKLAISSGLFKDPTTYKNIGSYSGKVSVYSYNGSSWNTYGDIITGNSGDLLGLSLSLNSNGNTLVIGSPGNSNNGFTFNGKVNIYNYDNENHTWVLKKEITGQESPQSLGSALSLSSDGKLLAISSAPDYIDDGNNTSTNYDSPCKVELYQFSDNSWNQIYNAIVENDVEHILGGSVSLSKNGKILGIGVLGLYNVNTYNIYDYVYNEGEINFIANNENISKIISTYDGNESTINFSVLNNNILEDIVIINKEGIDISGNITINEIIFSGSYNDLTNRPSLFSGSYYDLTNRPSLFSGSYYNLTNRPTIPTNNNQLTNGASYITYNSDTKLNSLSIHTFYENGYAGYSFNTRRNFIINNTGTVDEALILNDCTDGIIMNNYTQYFNEHSWRIVIESHSNRYLYFKFFGAGADYVGAPYYSSWINTGYIAWQKQNSLMNFTGQHRCFLNNKLSNSYEGLIVSVKGNYINLDNSIKPTINDSLPYCELTKKYKDPSIFGVISDLEDRERSFGAGNFVSLYEKANVNEHRFFINSIGEGSIWVCNYKGNLKIGDYIVSSSVHGYGCKQDNDILHNYTVAKITCECNFNLNLVSKKKVKIEKKIINIEEDVYENILENTEKKKIIFNEELERYVEESYNEITTKRELVYDEFDLYDENNNIIGKHIVKRKQNIEKEDNYIVYDENGDVVFEDDLDENGNIQYEYEYDTRFLDENANILSGKEEYLSRLNNGENVYIACFVGCSYHCG